MNAAVGTAGTRTDTATRLTANYTYDGTLEAVITVVEPLALTNGFVESQDFNFEAQKEVEQKAYAQGISIHTNDQKMYVHPNGDRLIVMKMWASFKVLGQVHHMKMLAIQLLNPGLTTVEAPVDDAAR